MTEIALMKNMLHALDLLKLMYVLLVGAPRIGQLVLDALEPPEEIEDLLVVLHQVLSEDGGKWGQVVHAIV
jgi:hypothetical protein